MPKRKLLTLTDDAAEFLPKLAGYHDQGAYVSQLIATAAVDANLVSAQDLAETQVDQDRPQEAYQSDFAQAQDADLVTLRRIVRKLLRNMAALEEEVARLKQTSTSK